MENSYWSYRGTSISAFPRKNPGECIGYAYDGKILRFPFFK